MLLLQVVVVNFFADKHQEREEPPASDDQTSLGGDNHDLFAALKTLPRVQAINKRFDNNSLAPIETNNRATPSMGAHRSIRSVIDRDTTGILTYDSSTF